MVPIVLHHGVLGFGNFSVGKRKVSYFGGGIDTAIAARGHPLVIAKVHPTAGIATRAMELKNSILRQLSALGRPDDKVVIIAHSMGGLDARYMISRLGMAPRVEALVTIASPHRGSAYADWCLKHLGERLGGLELAKFLTLDIQALSDLTTEHCKRFNDEVRDVPEVRYYSVTASRPWNKVPPFALHSCAVVHDAEGDNDCLVSVYSALWGKHLGTWPADHFRQVNKYFVIDPGGIVNVTPLYLKMLDQLRGEGVHMGDAIPLSHCPAGV